MNNLVNSLLPVVGILAALRRFGAWAATPVVVRRDGGWKYRLPDCEPDMTDPAIAAAVRRGKAREEITVAHAKAEEGR